MKKRIRILMPMLVTLAMVVSMVGMAIPALASEITATTEIYTRSSSAASDVYKRQPEAHLPGFSL